MSKKKKHTDKSHTNKAKTSAPQKEDFDEESNNDFGGLPDRDLKKNLGCG